jgi:hypothetical protein
VEPGFEPVEDNELLYRRVPESQGWYDASTRDLSPQAFAPHKDRDTTGLSVSRAKYRSIEEAAQGRAGKNYFIAILRAGDLRKRGIEVIPRPVLPTGEIDPSHAELANLNSANRKDDATLQRQRALATELLLSVDGPFATALGGE